MRKQLAVGIVCGVWIACLTLIVAPAGAWAAEGAPGFFMEAEAGPVFFNPPKRDSLPFYESDNAGTVNGRVLTDLAFSGDDSAPAGRIALGFRSANPDGNELLGSHPRVTLASTFFSVEDSDTGFPVPNGVLTGTATPDGWLSGVYFSNAGMAGLADIGYNGVISPVGQARVAQSADYDLADFSLTLAADYPAETAGVVLTPRVGLVYAFFDQDFHLYSETPASMAPLFYRYSTSETLETQYAGLALGLDARIPLGQGFSLTVGGTLMPLHAHTDMDLDYRGTSWPGGLPLATEVSERDDELTYRAMAQAELACSLTERLTVSLGAVVDYWEAVPVVEYPDFAPGEINLFTSPSPRKPEIDYDEMVNVLATVKISYAF